MIGRSFTIGMRMCSHDEGRHMHKRTWRCWLRSLSQMALLDPDRPVTYIADVVDYESGRIVIATRAP